MTPPTSNSFCAWVVADPNDPSLLPLEALGSRVERIVGQEARAFVGAPPPQVILYATGTTALFEAVWRMAHGTPWVHSRFAGVDHVLFPALVESNAILTNGRGAFAPALAEFTIGALLFFAKDFRRMIDRQREGVWDPFQPAELRGQTLGILGYGAIGRATARIARAMGMKIVASRRNLQARQPDPERAPELQPDAMFSSDQRAELFAASDHVLVATPLTPETHHMVGRRELGAMRPHGVFVNVGRGPVVDEVALQDALARGALRGAALDVFEVEPLPHHHPFFQNDRVLLSPHCADRVPGWLERATEVFVDNVERRLRGDALLNVVDKRRGY